MCKRNKSPEPGIEIQLGGCYHSGLAYALGYYVSDEVELDNQLFTNLHGGAMAALAEHRRQFDPSRDIERFIVALKPVQIISDTQDEKYDKQENNAGCDCCGEEDRVEGDKFCDGCINHDICEYCFERLDDCGCDCDDDNSCDKDYCFGCDCCDHENEFCEEFVVDTFRPMNAFARARWLSAQKKRN